MIHSIFKFIEFFERITTKSFNLIHLGCIIKVLMIYKTTQRSTEEYKGDRPERI